MDSSFNRKPKSYYVDYSKRRYDRSTKGDRSGEGSRFKSTPDLNYGHQGFLITAFDEVKCYLEMRHIFEEYFELIYNNQKSKIGQHTNDDRKEVDPNTIEDDIDQELKDLRKKRPFKQVKTHCSKSLFINIIDNFRYVDPVAIVDKFFDDMDDKKESRTSNTFKVLPILDTFPNSTSGAQKAIFAILQARFTESGPKNYFIEFQSRGNYKLKPDDKKEMVECVASAISEVKPDWKVSRDSADYMVILVAFRQVCCLSIVADYFKRKKYNIVEFCKPAGEEVPVPTEHQADEELTTTDETKQEA